MRGPVPSISWALLPFILRLVLYYNFIVFLLSMGENWDFKFLSGSRDFVLHTQHLAFQLYLHGPHWSKVNLPLYSFSWPLDMWPSGLPSLNSNSTLPGPFDNGKIWVSQLLNFTPALLWPVGHWGGRRAESMVLNWDTQVLSPKLSLCSILSYKLTAHIDGTSNNKGCLPEQGRAGSMLQAEVINKGWVSGHADGQLSGQWRKNAFSSASVMVGN